MTQVDRVCLPSVGKLPSALGAQALESSVKILKALGHPVRLRMMDLIHRAGGDICVCEFEQHFELKQPTISHHLRILRDSGLIRSRQDGTWVRHSIAPEGLAATRQLLDAFSDTPEHA